MIIIGLGNKGLSYKNTYHNMGFDVVSKLAKELGVRFSHTECKAKTAVTNVNGKRVVLAKPETYMNLSGESVRELMGKYKETADGIIVIYDDIDIAIGTIRARNAGSAGTHNGMRNIVECLNGNTAFKRIRIGTGFDHGNVPLYNVVLSKVKGENKTLVDASTDFVANELLSFLKDGDFDKLMRNVNGFKPE
ncbi:MAG: aminoacyl-tRNA hydrolase [Eubacteriales bacterium]|jgi:PTH1 family peptidyl-tRNA hydrolase|nr:aminoacyl-tRNA hydrolase [Clostridium sp.]MCI6059394.1 aminoacyl-tRNA hydrolase [Clostridiales bacterium]MDY2683202.1 aminoacyl-tRNA hydrolase [Eubacteriales bacterium]OKZ56748.1 MAG: aminoacyl-tRNA hydrolase [Clostridium sp. CAG:349_48_7]MCI6975994.1 aminoacyl-tRNA hydrolase [Clostridiales bacterium]